MEYFDIVDSADVPTGEKTTKAEAHAGSIMHRCVAVYVFDADNNLYVQDHNSGLLDHTVGGHVSAGEDYRTAAIRESEEEISLYDQVITELFLGLDSNELFNPQAQKQRTHHKFGLFESRPDERWKFVANDEVSRIFPMKLEEIAADMQQRPTLYTPGFINTMAKYIEIKSLPIPFDIEVCRSNWGKS